MARSRFGLSEYRSAPTYQKKLRSPASIHNKPPVLCTAIACARSNACSPIESCISLVLSSAVAENPVIFSLLGSITPMADVLESRTGSTLWDVLRNPMDNGAWKTFVQRYGPKISGWCRQRGLKRGGVEEVTQIVLVKLVQALRKFTYHPRKGRFRGWLKVVTDNAVADYRKALAGIGKVISPELIEVIGSHQAGNTLVQVIK